MKKIVTIIGARPQIIKASAISRAIATYFSDKLTEVIVHTGQHYDANMSEVFFKELGIPKPNYNLNVGSGKHGEQTAKMITGIEEILLNESPDFLVVYGDTNSTLAGAIAASKIHIPVVHIEAGLRSFSKAMPEEINRIMCDHVSTLLFSPTKTGYENLINEGFNKDAKPPYTIDNPKIYHCGDIMYDNSMYFSTMSNQKSTILDRIGVKDKNFALSTIHRDNNTDNKERLTAIFRGLNNISKEFKLDVVLPLHPRTKKLLETNVEASLLAEGKTNKHFKIIEPVSFLDMIALEKNSRIIVTDSGGVQKEAFFFKKPCVILRPETEWTELVENGTALITDADTTKIETALDYFLSKENLDFPPLFGDSRAAEFICEEILKI